MAPMPSEQGASGRKGRCPCEGIKRDRAFRVLLGSSPDCRADLAALAARDPRQVAVYQPRIEVRDERRTALGGRARSALAPRSR